MRSPVWLLVRDWGHATQFVSSHIVEGDAESVFQGWVKNAPALAMNMRIIKMDMSKPEDRPRRPSTTRHIIWSKDGTDAVEFKIAADGLVSVLTDTSEVVLTFSELKRRFQR